MLAIKLQRIGRIHQPSYRVVVAERRSKMGAPPVEDLGSYSPFSKAANLNKERVLYWVKMGAQPTATVHNLLIQGGVLSGPKIKISIKKKANEEVQISVPEVSASAPNVEAKESEGAGE